MFVPSGRVPAYLTHSAGVVRDFLEVVLSSIIREVSQQAPNDLRIRRRKEPIADADVFNMYLEALDSQYTRIEKFWAVRGYCPHRFRPSKVVEGDARTPKTVEALALTENSVDSGTYKSTVCYGPSIH